MEPPMTRPLWLGEPKRATTKATHETKKRERAAMNEKENLLSVSEVAERLGVSVACIYGLVASGDLLCYRIGLRRGTIRISEDQLLAYLNGTEQASANMTPAPMRPKTSLKHLQL
jgi:excisionase family DNA binding protein